MKKILLLIGLLIALAPRPAQAAIAFDNVCYATPAVTATLTWSCTVTGSNPVLVVFPWTYNDATVTGCTYNGVSMVQKATASSAVGSHLYVFMLAGVATGAHNVVCANTGSAANSVGVALSYTGASQTGIPDSSNTGVAAAATSITVATTVVAANSWLVMAAVSSVYGTTMTAGTGATLRVDGFGSANWVGGFDSNATVAAGSRSMQAVDGSASYWEAIIVSIAPPGAAPTGHTRSMLLGVGP